MIHPDTLVRPVHPQIGLGLIASKRIARGTITWVLDPLDQLLTPHMMATLPSACSANLDRYTWPDGAGNRILSWDFARLVNHSCDPSCLAGPLGCELAIRDIEAGEELTNDYANLGMRPDEGFQCLCGSPHCRGFISGSVESGLQRFWAAQVAAAAVHVPRVPQPLWTLLGKELQDQLRAGGELA